MSCGFKHNYFNCCSEGGCLCLQSACCPCFVLGKSTHRMENNGNMEGYRCVNLDCMVLCMLGGHGTGWIWNAYRRYQMRGNYGIGKQGCGGAVGDVCASICLTCALVQQEGEARNQNPDPKGPHMDQYQANGGMQVRR